MATDYSGLVSLLQGENSLVKDANMDADQILRALTKKAAISTDPMDIFKAELLAKAAAMQQLGSAWSDLY